MYMWIVDVMKTRYMDKMLKYVNKTASIPSEIVGQIL